MKIFYWNKKPCCCCFCTVFMCTHKMRIYANIFLLTRNAYKQDNTSSEGIFTMRCGCGKVREISRFFIIIFLCCTFIHKNIIFLCIRWCTQRNIKMNIFKTWHLRTCRQHIQSSFAVCSSFLLCWMKGTLNKLLYAVGGRKSYVFLFFFFLCFSAIQFYSSFFCTIVKFEKNNLFLLQLLNVRKEVLFNWEL